MSGSFVASRGGAAPLAVPSGFRLTCVTDTLHNVVAPLAGPVAPRVGAPAGSGNQAGDGPRFEALLAAAAPHADLSPAPFAAVAVGPVVGRLAPTSALVLMEFSTDGYAELRCVDQLSGVAHCCQVPYLGPYRAPI